MKPALHTHFSRISRELTQVQFEAEVDFVCHQMQHKYGGKQFTMAIREDLQKLLDAAAE